MASCLPSDFSCECTNGHQQNTVSSSKIALHTILKCNLPLENRFKVCVYIVGWYGLEHAQWIPCNWIKHPYITLCYIQWISKRKVQSENKLRLVWKFGVSGCVHMYATNDSV